MSSKKPSPVNAGGDLYKRESGSDNPPYLNHDGCANCDNNIRKGEKVSACCNGRTLGSRSPLDIEFYCKKCSAEDVEMKTVTAWKKNIAEEYRYYG